MKNAFFIFTLVTLMLQGKDVQAQDEEKYNAPQGLNNWFVEIAGAALFYSVNYEKYLFRSPMQHFTWTGRVGAGFNPIDYRLLNKVFLEQNSFMFPFTSSGLLGGRKEKIELGGGFTMLTKNFSENEIVPTLIIGFRVIETNRVCFRVAYTPHFRNGEKIDWIGVSIGKNFNFK